MKMYTIVIDGRSITSTALRCRMVLIRAMSEATDLLIRDNLMRQFMAIPATTEEV